MDDAKYSAVLRYAPIAPRKLRYTIDQIRGKSVNQALSTLRIITKRGAYYVNKVLNSAVANASNIDTDLDADNLRVAEARVDPGPIRRKWRSAPMGRAMPIRKRSSHIVISLVPMQEEEAPKEAKGAKKEAPKDAKPAPAEAKKQEPKKAEPKAEAKKPEQKAEPKKKESKGEKPAK